MAKHTRGRLTIDEWGGVNTEDGRRLLLTGVAITTGNDPRMIAEANVARMVLAWNAHDDLCAACEAMLRHIDQVGDDEDLFACRGRICAALAKARGEAQS